jgi:hypothetical protein
MKQKWEFEKQVIYPAMKSLTQDFFRQAGGDDASAGSIQAGM